MHNGGVALSDPRPAEILLVDDRPENLRALRAILGDQPGYSLVEASSGPEALREVLRHDFCLILLDAFLPGMDGVEVASLIKQRERTRDIPIIFLTAAGMDQETLRRAYAAGAADYLLKPISPEIVRAKVAVFVDLARKSAQLKEQAELLQEAERREQAAACRWSLPLAPAPRAAGAEQERRGPRLAGDRHGHRRSQARRR